MPYILLCFFLLGMQILLVLSNLQDNLFD